MAHLLCLNIKIHTHGHCYFLSHKSNESISEDNFKKQDSDSYNWMLKNVWNKTGLVRFLNWMCCQLQHSYKLLGSDDLK